jgi:hypothetical protein
MTKRFLKNQFFLHIFRCLKNVHKSILITKLGLFDWIVMTFGMKNATSTFSRTMTEVFGTYMHKFLKVFVDDLNVHNLSWEEHLKHLQYVLMKLREINFKLNPSKCEFANFKLAFLGHEVNQEGTQSDHRKVQVLMNFCILIFVINV